MSKTLIAGSVAAATFLSYCVYFDYKRRSDPLYKIKLREKRRAEREQAKVGSRKRPNFVNNQSELVI